MLCLFSFLISVQYSFALNITKTTIQDDVVAGEVTTKVLVIEKDIRHTDVIPLIYRGEDNNDYSDILDLGNNEPLFFSGFLWNFLLNGDLEAEASLPDHYPIVISYSNLFSLKTTFPLLGVCGIPSVFSFTCETVIDGAVTYPINIISSHMSFDPTLLVTHPGGDYDTRYIHSYGTCTANTVNIWGHLQEITTFNGIEYIRNFSVEFTITGERSIIRIRYTH